MIKLTNIYKTLIKENKEAVIQRLQHFLRGEYKGSSKYKILKKITNDISPLEGEELHQYFTTNMMDRKNSWEFRYMLASLLKTFEGK